MQMWQWGSLKEQTGPWCAHRLEMLDSDGTSVGGAQVLVRKMPWPFGAIAYAPRGPFSADGRLMEVADTAAEWCRAHTKA